MAVGVFVFGTLKRGFPLHARGLGGAVFVGRARTVRGYPLVIAGPWFAPMMLDEPGRGHRVEGELFEVDAAVLDRLDKLESVGRPGNLRIVIEVEPLPEGARRTAFAFAKARNLAVPLHSGYLDFYDDRRFVAPEDRPATG